MTLTEEGTLKLADEGSNSWSAFETKLVTHRYDVDYTTKLKKLDFSECEELTQLPSSLGVCKNLEELVLQQCAKLTDLPESVGACENLITVDLESCSELRRLPE